MSGPNPSRGPGRLWGVGVGPGDPELVTLKAQRVLAAADVVAYHSARHGRSIAREIAASHLRGDQVEEALVYPVTTETTDHPGGYQAAIDSFYEQCAARIAAHLDAGRDVAVLCEGDPFFYGSYMHLHKRLAHRYPATVVPGVTSVSAASALVGHPLAEGDEVLTVLPGILPADELARRLAKSDAAVILKLGRTFPEVRQALEASGRLEDAWYVERATTDRQRAEPLAGVDPASVPYFSLALVPGPLGAIRPAADPSLPGLNKAGKSPLSHDSRASASDARDRVAGTGNDGHTETAIVASTGSPLLSARAGDAKEPSEGTGELQADQLEKTNHLARPARGSSQSPSGLQAFQGPVGRREPGSLVVVGLGPSDRGWVTPEARAALDEADELVGYGPYLARVAPNPRQRRHTSDNRAEAERAALALELALGGSRVAVVSSGDPGVFAMATAVLEAACDERFAALPVRVLPGLTAAQAVASRVGAPLGHDYCVLSLSDRLKPWSVIEERLVAAAKADLVIAVYNPASRSRTTQLAAARDLLLTYRSPATPVVVGRDVGGPEEDVRVVDLAGLDPAEIDMRCLLIVGSSQTRVVERAGGRRVVFTPRRYPG